MSIIKTISLNAESEKALDELKIKLNMNHSKIIRTLLVERLKKLEKREKK